MTEWCQHFDANIIYLRISHLKGEVKKYQSSFEKHPLLSNLRKNGFYEIIRNLAIYLSYSINSRSYKVMKMSEKSERRSSYVYITVVTCPPSGFLVTNVHMADSNGRNLC